MRPIDSRKLKTHKKQEAWTHSPSLSLSLCLSLSVSVSLCLSLSRARARNKCHQVPSSAALQISVPHTHKIILLASTHTRSSGSFHSPSSLAFLRSDILTLCITNIGYMYPSSFFLTQ